MKSLDPTSTTTTFKTSSEGLGPKSSSSESQQTLHIIGVPDGKEKEAESFFEEIMAENSPNLRKQIDTQTQGVHLKCFK